jgi:hypothetical protein
MDENALFMLVTVKFLHELLVNARMPYRKPFKIFNKYGKPSSIIHLFTNSDAILNHDALWVIQGKNPNSKAFNVVLRHNTIIFL